MFLGAFSCSKTTPGKAPKEQQRFSRKEILEQKKIPIYTFRVIKTYPHNKSHFTEGFLMNDGVLYEGTGLYGDSHIIKSNLKTGATIKSRKLNVTYGEGITIIGDNLYQLTYISNIGYVYDKNTFQQKRTFSFPSQGWGLTTDGKSLIMSDGSSAIRYINPETFKEEKYIIVSNGEKNIGYINELEYINGKIYANVWKTNFIIIISPLTGKILGWIDLKGINQTDKHLTFEQVLNGIAYNEKTKNLLITGKQWSKIYEIKLVLK